MRCSGYSYIYVVAVIVGISLVLVYLVIIYQNLFVITVILYNRKHLCIKYSSGAIQYSHFRSLHRRISNKRDRFYRVSLELKKYFFIIIIISNTKIELFFINEQSSIFGVSWIKADMKLYLITITRCVFEWSCIYLHLHISENLECRI
jgi:hypothetical protein